MTAYKDGSYQWILHYQDHHDKMSYLCAMEDRKPKTVAFHLLPLFLQQGAPLIHLSDNGREFVAKVIEELLKIWKDCKIVHGSLHHPQSQGSVERAKADIETMVTQWMKDENSTKWSWGIHFIAHKKKTRYHEGIKQIPYVLRYGQPCRVGLSRMNLPAGLLSQLQSEKDLEAAMEQASVITATHARNALPAQVVTITEAARAGSPEVQVVVCQQKKRKAASSQVVETIDYQPGEYELMVIQKRKRNEEKLKQLGLNVAK
jgi:hypothetical protein